jgi:hypothetical protein
MRGPDLLQLGYKRSLHGRGRCFSGLPVGPVRRQIGELSSNTTTMRSRLPDERALTWLGLNLEKLGFATLAPAGEPAVQPTPVAVTAAAPSNETTLREVKDILLSPSRPALGSTHR